MTNIDSFFAHLDEKDLKRKIGKKADCLHLLDVRNYVDERLSELTAQAFDRHFEKCKECYAAIQTYRRYS